MQTNNKQKQKKIIEGFSSTMNGANDSSTNNKMEEFVECGAICNDDTYTGINGRGAGSRHGGVKYKLYAKRIDAEANEIALGSKSSLSTNGSKSQSNEPQCSNPTSSTLKKKMQRKTGLKQLFKTKAKKTELFEKVYGVFDKMFKESLQFSKEQIQDENIWLLFASISSLYEDLLSVNESVKQMQVAANVQKNQEIPSQEEYKKFSNDVEAFLRPDYDALRKENKELSKQILKISKQNTKLKENLNLYKIKEKNFKKMLKIIESTDPETLNGALEKSKINVKDLKTHKQEEEKVITRSMAKKSSKKEQKKKESIFSSDDSSDFYDEDSTIRNIIKSMK